MWQIQIHILYITHITYITHKIKLIFKAYKETKKNILIFFIYIKMKNSYYQKHKEKAQKEAPERFQNLSKEEKKWTKKDMKKISKSF